MDAARVAKRLGSEVTILYRREKSDMPADEEEIGQAEEEGIPIMTLVAPSRILVTGGRVRGIALTRMRAGDYDTAGRRMPVAGDETITLECDTVIAAIGQVCDSEFIGKAGVTLRRNGTVQVDPFTLATNVAGVYAGGDLVTGPWTVSGAMGQGKQFARVIDKHLMGEDRFAQLFKKVPYNRDVSVEPQGGQRNHMPTVSPETRRNNFEEVTRRYEPEVAKIEVTRCLRCDVKE
jgi:NADH-quinone oxidoreductase subunit F